MLKRITIPALLLAFLASLSLESAAEAANRHRARARLFGFAPMKGQARYEERERNGQDFQRFKVEIERALPFSQFQVHVNGMAVGTISVNGFGRGKLDMRTAAFIDDPGDGIPIPNNFPTLDTGDLVTVGPLQGVFFDQENNNTQRYRLRGRASLGNDQLEAKADYRERFKNGGLRRDFSVEVEDAAQGDVFDVRINGTLFGQVVIGVLGEGELQLRTAAFIDSPGDGSPMPNSFPSLQAGDVVQVGPLNVVMGIDD